MNRDLAIADWLEELAVYGKPRKFQHAEISFHLCELIRHRYFLSLSLAHSPINLGVLGMPAPTRVALQASRPSKGKTGPGRKAVPSKQLAGGTLIRNSREVGRESWHDRLRRIIRLFPEMPHDGFRLRPDRR